MKIIGFILFALTFIIVSLPVVIPHPILNFDDFALVEPLQKLDSVAGYFEALNKNQIMDVNPVRDLSYWIEQQVGGKTGYINYQLDNVVLWISTIVVFSTLLSQLGVPSLLIIGAMFIIGLHPVIHSSVFWVAGRKHLLAALFLLSAVLFLSRPISAKKNLNLLGSFLCYLLSAFSQPIGFAFPIFAFSWILTNRSLKTISYQIYLGACTVVAVSVGYLNWKYYSSASYANTGGTTAPKFNAESIDMVVKRFLVWGRDAFQIFLPIRPSVHSYNLSSATSILGLLLLSALMFTLLKIKSRLASTWPWLIFAILPVGVVTLKLTSQGGVDNYLLLPLFGIAAFSLLTFPNEFLKTRKGLWLTIIVAFIAIDLFMANAWADSERLWKVAADYEGSKEAKSQYLRVVLNSSSPDRSEVLKRAEELAQIDPNNSSLGYDMGKSIYIQMQPSLEKDKLFATHKVDDVWFDYFWSANDAQQGLFDRASQRLATRWQRSPSRFVLQAAFAINDIESKWIRMCELAKRQDCNSIKGQVAAEIKKIENASR